MKTTKIYNNEKEVYSGNCYVNTVIFRGRIYDEFKKVGQNGIRFSLQLSNGKDPKTGKWNKPKDEIWLIAKYYSKQQDGKYYKGFIVREIITEQEIQRGTRAGNSRLKYSEKCSTNARENSNFETFDDLPF
jgi:hypothetical protein